MEKNTIPKTFEDGMNELETLVRTLEEGRMPLEAAITAFERGTYLRRFCEEKLMSAKLKVDHISKDSEGKIAIKTQNSESVNI